MTDFVGSHSVPLAGAGDVLRGLAERGTTVSVQQTMRSKVETASPSEPLDGALTRILQNGCRVLMVVDNEKVVGLLTAGNVGELIALEAAGREVAKTEEGAGR